MRFAKRVCVFLIVLFLLSVSGFAVFRHQKGDKLLSVQTGSMAPYINIGDAVLTHKTSVAALKVGDVISYHNPTNQKVIVSHRLVSINKQTGKLATKGDALDLKDIPFPSYLVVGKVYKVLPHVGSVLDWLHEPIGLIVAVYAPAAIVLVYEAKRFARQYKRSYYCLYGYQSGSH